MTRASEVNGPRRGSRDGPLVLLLLLLTVGTGVVDATSILGLGRVFVANMTGNIVFIGFGLVGAPGFSVVGSLVALAAFLLGAVLGGELGHRSRSHRGRMLRNGLIVETALLVAAAAIAVPGPGPLPFGSGIAVLTAEGVALGVQNAVVRRLAVPDLTTTVLTMSITGIGADLRRGDRVAVARRGLSVLSMLVGAAVGAALVLLVSLQAALLGQCVLLAGTLIGAAIAARGDRDWHAPR